MSKFGDLKLDLKSFDPFFPLWTGHSQTLLGHLIPSAQVFFDLQSEVIVLPDGDEVRVEFRSGISPFTLLVFHGLGGNAQADYMRRSAIIAYERGWNIVLVNHRSASVLAKSRRTYHSGRGEDVEEVLKWSQAKFTGAKTVALGFSMSGSIVLNLLTKRFGSLQPDYAVIVNAPLDLAKAANRLTQGFSKVYDYRFYLMLKRLVLRNAEKRENNLVRQLNFPTLGRTLDFDEIYTAPFNGFASREDYYEKCSVKNFLDRIETKTFVLTSKDDPFIDVRDYYEGNWSQSVQLTVSDFGGHMGYFSKKQDSKFGRRWLDYYLDQVLGRIEYRDKHF